MKTILICFFSIFLTTACLSSTPQGMQRFVDIQEMVVREKHRIDGYLEKESGVEVLNVQEVQLGILEYSFIEKKSYRPFEDPEKLCKFIFVVKKNTGIIIGWRYNSKPEYCYSGNT